MGSSSTSSSVWECQPTLYRITWETRGYVWVGEGRTTATLLHTCRLIPSPSLHWKKIFFFFFPFLIFFRHADEIFERPINHVLCLCGNTPLLTSFEFNYLFFNVYDMKWMKRCIMYLDGRIFELIFLLFLNETFFFSPVGNGGALRFELKIIWLIF